MKIGDLVQANDDIPTIMSEDGSIFWARGALGLIIDAGSELDSQLHRVKSGLDTFHVWEKEMTLGKEHP